MGPPGFARAPVSKGIFCLTLVSSIASSLVKDRNFFALGLEPLIGKRQFWRLISCQFVVDPLSEALLMLFLVYIFRLFERQYGSKKFAGSLMFFALTSTLFQIVILYLFPQLKYFSSGPYWFVYGLFVQFFVDIPRSAQFTILRLLLSDKSLVYLLGLQLMLSSFPNSVYSAGCGLLTGIIYRMFPVLTHIRPPQFLISFCERFFSPLFSPSNAVGNSHSNAYSSYAMNGGSGNGNVGLQSSAHVYAPIPQHPQQEHGDWSSATVPQSTVVPDESAVTQLIQMGFSEADVRRVLSSSNNNIAIATTRLVEQR